MSQTWDIPTLPSFNDGKPHCLSSHRASVDAKNGSPQDGVEELVVGEDVDKIGLPGYLENLYAMLRWDSPFSIAILWMVATFCTSS